jgi:hypothetical protein
LKDRSEKKLKAVVDTVTDASYSFKEYHLTEVKTNCGLFGPAQDNSSSYLIWRYSSQYISNGEIRKLQYADCVGRIVLFVQKLTA